MSLIDLWQRPTPAYNDFEKCKRLLRFGIVGYKYNYKNNKSRKIMIQLSADLTKIVYQDMKENGNWQVFSGTSTLKLAKFTGLIYGG